MLHSKAWAAGAKLHDVTRLTKPSLVQGMAISIHVPSRVCTAQRASHLFFANGDASRGQVMSIPTEPNAILDWIDDHSLGDCPLVHRVPRFETDGHSPWWHQRFREG